MDWIQLGQGPVLACCGHGNEEADPVANWEIGGQLKNLPVYQEFCCMEYCYTDSLRPEKTVYFMYRCIQDERIFGHILSIMCFLLKK
jgi:hypothetical protein